VDFRLRLADLEEAMRNALLAALCVFTALSCPNAYAEEAPASPCSASKRFVFPAIYWTGEFVFKTNYQVRSGHAAAIEVAAERGADRTTDDVLIGALKQQIAENYSCAVPDQDVEEFLQIDIGHDVPELADGLAKFRVQQARYQTEKQTVDPNVGEPVDPARRLCPKLIPGGDFPPSGIRPGTYIFHVIGEVRDGVLGRVDVKIRKGSKDSRLNRQLLRGFEAGLREEDGAHCEGSGVFEKDVTMVTRIVSS